MIDQGQQEAQIGAGHLLSRVTREATAKGAEGGHDGALFGQHHLPGAIKDSVHAALADRQVGQLHSQEVQTARDLSRYLRRRQQFQPGRGQHQRQRHSLHLPTDVGYVGHVGRGDGKAGAGAASALGKELHGGVVQGVFGRHFVGELQPAQFVAALPGQVEPLARSSQN